MQQITDPTAVVSLPAPPALTGTTGFFGPAVPGISVATRFRYWFANMVMMELVNLCSAAGVASDTTGTRFTDVTTAVLNLIKANGLIGQRLMAFRTPGAFTWTVPTGVIAFEVEMWGAGSGSWASTTTIPGGGGSGGSYVRASVTGVAAGMVFNGVVGAAGVAGTASPVSSPTAGTDTTFAAATGGSLGGTLIAAGGILNSLNSPSAPSFGNLGTPGTIYLPNVQVTMVGGDGQTAIGTQGGMGGISPRGGTQPNSGTAGRVGNFPGGGASGAGCPSGTAYAGAAGAPGLVLITVLRMDCSLRGVPACVIPPGA